MTELNTDTQNMKAALKAAGEVLYALKDTGMQQGAEYVAPAAFKSELDEIAEAMSVREAAQAELNGLPADIRSKLPGSLVASIMKCTTHAQLSNASATLASVAESIAASKETGLAIQHADEMTPEQKMAHLKHEIDELDETMEARMRRLYNQGDIPEETYNKYMAALEYAKANPTDAAAQIALSRTEHDIADIVAPAQPDVARAIDEGSDKRADKAAELIALDKEMQSQYASEQAERGGNAENVSSADQQFLQGFGVPQSNAHEANVLQPLAVDMDFAASLNGRQEARVEVASASNDSLMNLRPTAIANAAVPAQTGRSAG